MEQDTTLLLEGGAMRGLYTSGVLDVLMENDLYLPNVVGVSAGALNGVNYLARQPGRSLRANLDYLNDPRYMGPGHLLKEFSFFNFDFLLGEMAAELLPFDYDTFFASPQRLWAEATDCRTGRAVFYEKAALGRNFFTAVRASASMPLLGSMVRVERDVCLDGGVANCIPIPADLPFPAGRTVLVLTRQKGFRKPAQSGVTRRLYHRRYGAYPALLAACLAQPEVYNAQMDRIDRLEEEGRVFVLRPGTPVTVGRTEKDKAKLQALYDQGRRETTERLAALKEYLAL